MVISKREEREISRFPKIKMEYFINYCFGMSSIDSYKFTSGKVYGEGAHGAASDAKKYISDRIDIEKFSGTIKINKDISAVEILLLEKSIINITKTSPSNSWVYLSNIISYLLRDKFKTKGNKNKTKLNNQITDKQRRFVEEYCMNGFNSARAAIAAGYSERTARSIGSENLAKPIIINHINKMKEKITEKAEASHYIRIGKHLHEYLEDSDIEDIGVFCTNAITMAIEKDYNIETVKRRRDTSSSRYSVLERAGFKCQCCGSKPSKDNDVVLHVDHIIPFSLGGSNDISNLQALCDKCNISKGNRHINDHNAGWIESKALN